MQVLKNNILTGEMLVNLAQCVVSWIGETSMDCNSWFNPGPATYTFKEIILFISLIQVGKLSVTDESMHTQSTSKQLRAAYPRKVLYNNYWL